MCTSSTSLAVFFSWYCVISPRASNHLRCPGRTSIKSTLVASASLFACPNAIVLSTDRRVWVRAASILASNTLPDSLFTISVNVLAFLSYFSCWSEIRFTSGTRSDSSVTKITLRSAMAVVCTALPIPVTSLTLTMLSPVISSSWSWIFSMRDSPISASMNISARSRANPKARRTPIFIFCILFSPRLKSLRLTSISGTWERSDFLKPFLRRRE